MKGDAGTHGGGGDGGGDGPGGAQNGGWGGGHYVESTACNDTEAKVFSLLR